MNKILMGKSKNDTLEDLIYRAEDLIKEHKMPVQFKWGAQLYTLEPDTTEATDTRLEK